MNTLVINSGSSSIKLSLFSNDDILLHAHVDGIGGNTITTFEGATIRRKLDNHEQALSLLFQHLPADIVVDRVGHRVVHGGELYVVPTKISSAVLRKLKSLVELAPLHLPANIAGIVVAKQLLPRAMHVAVFDTAFHSTIPEVAYRYGVEQSWYKKYGIRKYGFHGTSHQFMMEESKKLLHKRYVNIISCHLGNGSSVCAIRKNKSIETSMGFSPLSGVLMGTRSGDLDPEVIFYLKEHGLKLDEIEQHLEKNSGFKGLMGTNDLRIIYKKAKEGHKRAQLAIDLFAYEVARYVGMYASLMSSVDALVFTGGIGELAFYIRKKVVNYIPYLNIKIDGNKNRANKLRIHAPNSNINVYVIPTNEELVIARHTKDV